jgi:hypothetical protein
MGGAFFDVAYRAKAFDRGHTTTTWVKRRSSRPPAVVCIHIVFEWWFWVAAALTVSCVVAALLVGSTHTAALQPREVYAQAAEKGKVL